MNIQTEQNFNNEVIDTRKQVIEREHSALLIWGMTSVSITLLIYFMQLFTGDYYWWLWIVLPVIALPIHYMVDKRVDAKYGATRLTPLYKTLEKVGIITVTLILITSLLSLVYSFNAYFVILIILSLWCGLSGYMLNYSHLIQLAAVGFLSGITARVQEANESALILFALGLTLVLIMPGVDMKKR